MQYVYSLWQDRSIGTILEILDLDLKVWPTFQKL
jgi:hypothetical protein